MRYPIRLIRRPILPRDPDLTLRMSRLPDPVTITETITQTITVPGEGGETSGCGAVSGFTWADFVADIDAADATATYLDTTLDNVRWNLKFGGSLTAWKAKSGSGTKISARLGNTGSFGSLTYRPILFSLLAQNQPRQPLFGTTNAADVSANPAYAALNAVMLSGDEIDPAILDGDQAVSFPGVAATGNQVFVEARTTNDELWFESWLDRNPDATNTTQGYPGRTVFGDWGYAIIDNATGPVAIDDFRIGLFEIDADITDPDFDGSTMRAGFWVVPDGSGHLVRTFVNGVQIETHTTPSVTGVLTAAFNPHVVPSTTTADGKFQLTPEIEWDTDGENWGGDGNNFVYQPMIASCLKYGAYIKPKASNANAFDFLPTFSMATNPKYAI